MANDGAGKGFFSNLFDKVKAGMAPVPQQPAPKPPVPRAPQNPSSTFVRNTGPLNATPATGPLRTPPITRTPEELAEESQMRQAFIMAYLKDPDVVPEFRDPKYVYKVVSDERSYQTQEVAKLEEKLRLFLQSADPAFLMPGEDEVPAMELGPDGEPSPEAMALIERIEAKQAFLAQREEIEAEIQKIRDFQTKLFLILKNVTGIKKKTGGTGFLTPPPGV
ncbi:hypothetical protein J7643_02710 [bacterium]|nr:hypothetical protein [bacterium]